MWRSDPGPRIGLATLALLVSSVLGGCESGRSTLTVRVQSGLRAGHEVRFVEAAVFRGSVSCAAASGAVGSDGRALGPEDQGELGRGTISVGEFSALEAGTYTVRVQARRPGEGSPDSGPVLIERCVVTSLSNDRVVRVALTSDCINVTCPAPGGSAAFDQCLNGRCVDPRCDPGDPATAELCCDRTVLGNTCDDDPTLCRSAMDCTPTLGCSGDPTCEEGACIEPAADTCDEGTYCDATTNECEADPVLAVPDAGPRDASIDAATDLDAPLLDAPSSDAWSPDAASSPDAWSADAFVTPGTDAPFPDAFEPAAADAFAVPGADAWSPDAFAIDAAPSGGTLREDCFVVGDENANGVGDCDDPACMPICIAGCTPTTPMGPLGDIPPPRHWYRGDRLMTMGGIVCAWPDLVGGAHFAADVGSPPTAPAVPAIELNADQAMNVEDDLGVGLNGNYTVFLVTQRPGTTGMGATVLRTWYPLTSRQSLQTRQSYMLPAAYELTIRNGVYGVGSEATTAPTVETIAVGALVSGMPISPRVQYRRNAIGIVPSLSSGSDTASGGGTAMGDPRTTLGGAAVQPIRVFEIIIYAGVLSDSDRDLVEVYLIGRYPM